MIFERAIRREFAQSAAGVTVALLAILTSTQLIRLLKEAAGGRIAPEAVVYLLGFASLKFVPVVLSLALFVAVLLTLSRVYRDSEMAVWLSSGLPLTAWIRPVLVFSLPIVVVIALLSAYLSPWASLNANTYRDYLASRNDVSQVSPGAFKESKNGERVFFVEAVGDDAKQVGNVFVATVQGGRLGVIFSDHGEEIVAENGDRFIVLHQGRRYEIERGSPAVKVMDYEHYQVRTEDAKIQEPRLGPPSMPLGDLVAQFDLPAQGEIVWRLGMPLAAIILCLFAIPLSFVNPRAGRSANILIAILIYAIYNNLLSISQVWVTSGKVPFVVGLLGLHTIMFIVFCGFLYMRTSLSLFAFIKGRQ